MKDKQKEVLKVIDDAIDKLSGIKADILTESLKVDAIQGTEETSNIEVKKGHTDDFSLRGTLTMLNLPNDDDICETLQRIIKRKNIPPSKIKDILCKVNVYRNKEDIANMKGYIIGAFKKSGRK